MSWQGCKHGRSIEGAAYIGSCSMDLPFSKDDALGSATW
eukprot:06721.XXX_52128_52244_1 [CDS] Oithona nana genome sequencing.